MSVQCCATSTTTGQRCKRYAIEGATVCRAHGAAAPQVQRRAAERVLETRLAGELTRREIEPVTNPVEAVQYLAGESLAWLDVVRGQVAKLSAVNYSDERGSQDVRPAIALYERALVNAARLTTDMVRLGVEAKLATQLEKQAAEIVALVRLAVQKARAEPDRPADAIILELIGGAS